MYSGNSKEGINMPATIVPLEQLTERRTRLLKRRAEELGRPGNVTRFQPVELPPSDKELFAGAAGSWSLLSLVTHLPVETFRYPQTIARMSIAMARPATEPGYLTELPSDTSPTADQCEYTSDTAMPIASDPLDPWRS
jgi:hypothetical protein